MKYVNKNDSQEHLSNLVIRFHVDYKLNIFRIDENCFLIFLPQHKKYPLIRIGNSSKLTPFFKDYIGEVVLTKLLKTDFLQEMKTLQSKLSEHTCFIALPSVMRQFEEKTDKLNQKTLQIQKIPVKTGSEMGLSTETDRIQVRFYRNDNVKIVLGEAEIFDLSSAINSQFNTITTQKEIEKLRTYLDLYGNSLQGKLKNLLDFWKEDNLGKATSIFTNLKKSLIEQNLLGDNQEIFLRSKEDQKIPLKATTIEFCPDEALNNLISLEIQHLLKVGSKYKLELSQNSQTQCQVELLLIDGSMIHSASNFQFVFQFNRKDEQSVKTLDTFRKIQNYFSLKQLLKK